MSYSIKVLSSQEFEELPYQHVKEAFAVTSPDQKNIYVRHSKVHDFNKMLIGHELDHLTEDYPTDEGPDGERYFLGNLLSNIWGGIKNVGSGLFGGLKSVGGGIMNAFKGGSPLQGMKPTAPNYYIPGGGPGFLNQPRQQQQSSGFGSGFKSGFGEGGFKEGLGSGLGGILSSFLQPSSLLGAGLLGAGFMKKYPKPPPFPQSFENLRTQNQAGGGQLSQLANQKLTGQLNEDFQPLQQPEIDAALRELERNQVIEEDRVRDLYHNLRPGSDPTTDASFQKDLATVSDQFSRAKADTLATRTRDTKANFDAQRMTQIKQAMLQDETLRKEAMEIAQMDIELIMAKYNLDVAQATALKETLINLGSDLLFSGFSPQQSDTYNVFQAQ